MIHLYVLFRAESEDQDDMPWVVGCVDEFTVSDNGFPQVYVAERAKPLTRELIVAVPDAAVRKLFLPQRTPMVTGVVVEPK